MSCDTCMYISGHSETCPIGLSDRADDNQYKNRALDERCEALEGRCDDLEERISEMAAAVTRELDEALMVANDRETRVIGIEVLARSAPQLARRHVRAGIDQRPITEDHLYMIAFARIPEVGDAATCQSIANLSRFVATGQLICALEQAPQRFPFTPQNGDWSSCCDAATFARLLPRNDEPQRTAAATSENLVRS